MRCWHKSLIPYLPRQQLLGQWREYCLIAKNIAEKGTPNHILVNRIMDYPLNHFYNYGCLVYNETIKRRYITYFYKFGEYFTNFENSMDFINYNNIFPNWHNNKYLIQCYYNLQEKYDCGGISEEEWNKIINNISIKRL